MAKAPVLTPQSEDFPRWYQDIVAKAELADNGPVRGTMVIRPYGYSIWEQMQAEVDRRIKLAGAKNAYFPLFIPESYLKREAEHVEGFSPELAVVTVAGGKELEEPVVVRPTSETVIGEFMAKWVQSYRDLPLLLNQWANVVRWEMRTRLFLRTAEFLWQEGHTAHATKEEALVEARKMLDVYSEFAETFMAVPVIKGVKTEKERFAGADDTYCIEGMMQDGKALQMGTSHFLGQNFAKAFDVKFQSKEGKLEYVWATSWGVSTRLMGALIMTHSDDEGLVLPPKLAPIHVVIVPVYRSDEDLEKIKEAMKPLSLQLKALGLTVKFDDRDTYKPGYKFAEWELKGVPVRLAVGMRDLESGTVEVARRDTKEKFVVAMEDLQPRIVSLMDEIQQNLFDRAAKYREEKTQKVNSWDEFLEAINVKEGFAIAHWDGTGETEEKIKELTKATIRCIAIDQKLEDGICVYSGKPSTGRVVFAKAY